MISESYVLEVDKQGEGSTDLHDTEVIKLSEVERESYITLFSSVLISHKDLVQAEKLGEGEFYVCLLYTSPSPRDATLSRMPSSA